MLEINQNENPAAGAKQLALAAWAYLALAADWLLIRHALYGQGQLLFWVWPAVVTILSICALSFFALVRPNRLLALSVHALSLLTYLVLMPKDFYVILGGAIFFVFAVIFHGWIAREGENLLSFSVNRTVGTTQVLLSYGFLLLLGMNIYYNTSQDFKQNPDMFYNRVSDSISRSIPFFSENLGQKPDPSESLDQYLLTETKDTQGRSLAQLNGRQQSNLLSQARTEFSKQFGIQATGKETMSDVVGQIVTERVRPVLDRYGKYFPIIFTLVILALLRTFAFVFSWLTLLGAWLLFRLLLMLGFFRLERVSVEVQKLRI